MMSNTYRAYLEARKLMSSTVNQQNILGDIAMLAGFLVDLLVLALGFGLDLTNAWAYVAAIINAYGVCLMILSFVTSESVHRRKLKILDRASAYDDETVSELERETPDVHILRAINCSYRILSPYAISLTASVVFGGLA